MVPLKWPFLLELHALLFANPLQVQYNPAEVPYERPKS